MKIINKENKKTTFGELDTGEVFYFDHNFNGSHIYMKIYQVDEWTGEQECCLVDLTTGEIDSMSDEYEVVPIEAELHIK
jgi:hypothetical protein